MSYSFIQSLPSTYGMFPYKKIWSNDYLKQKASSSKVIYIARINDKLVMKEPLSLRYHYDSGYYYIAFERGPMIITVADEKEENLAKKFKDEICEAWDYFVNEKDENLTDGAIKVKKWLLDIIFHS